MKDPF